MPLVHKRIPLHKGRVELNISIFETENAAFGDWTYYDLANKISYKAEEDGIAVMETNSRNAKENE